ncbi:hypothetical protein LvStA_03394 [Burkholderia gladioli]|nr:hypothetical protein LvStA_03394 [Burkholderia gladioli]
MSDSTTPTYQEPSGSAEQRVANLQTLEDGEKTKQQQMGWVDGANYGMTGADIGYAAYAGGSAALAGAPAARPRSAPARWPRRPR